MTTTSADSSSIAERVKANRAQRGTEILSPTNGQASGDNLRMQSSSSTPASRKRKSRDQGSDSESARPKKKTVWTRGYNEDSDGAESEADLSLATKPNIRRKRVSKAEAVGSGTDATTTAASSTKSVTPQKEAVTKNDDLEEGEILEETPKKVVSKSPAKKRNYIDGSASSADKGAERPAKKQKIATKAEETVNKDMSSQKSSTKKMTDDPSSKKRKAGDGPASTSDNAPAAPSKKRKTGTDTAIASKKATSLNQATPPKKTVEKKRVRNTAASEKTSVNTNTEETEKSLEPEAPKKKQVPKEYKNNARIRMVVDTFCITKGIGLFEDMRIEEQERLVKKMKKRSEYVALLDIRKAAVSSHTREKNRWKNKGQHDNVSALFFHQRKLNELQRSLDDTEKAIDAWEARDGHISYRLAYNAAVAGKKKTFKIDHACDEGMLGRRSAFFASRLPVEVWEQRVAEECDAGDTDSEGYSLQKSREDRLQQIKEGKSSDASKTDGVNEGNKNCTVDKD